VAVAGRPSDEIAEHVHATIAVDDVRQVVTTDWDVHRALRTGWRDQLIHLAVRSLAEDAPEVSPRRGRSRRPRRELTGASGERRSRCSARPAVPRRRRCQRQLPSSTPNSSSLVSMNSTISARAVELRQAGCVVGRGSGPVAVVDLDLDDPVAQGLGVDAELLGDSFQGAGLVGGVAA